MPPPIAASQVFIAEDLRNIFEALEAARPDLTESLDLVRIAIGLRPASQLPRRVWIESQPQRRLT